MFQRKDYLAYFRKILEYERGMIKKGSELRRLTKNKEAIMLLDSLIRDERRHARIVNRIIKYF